jgi:proteasome assembly chaperone (PAC2) family protein
MSPQPIRIDYLPDVKDPVLIAGFDGWGNALDVSKAMISFLIRKLNAQPFATINADLFYRFDESRPFVDIQEGHLKGLSLPGGSFFAASSGDDQRSIVLLRAMEPQLRWVAFAEALLSLCETLGIGTIITIGSMYDSVLHTDRIISGLASSEAVLQRLVEKGVIPINYHGPSAIHSTIHSEALKRGLACLSLWCHCPYYLQGATHFGLLSELSTLLSDLGGFELDSRELEESWKELTRQINELLEKNPELQAMINEIRKAKVRGSWEHVKEGVKKDDKVIYLTDFLKPK